MFFGANRFDPSTNKGLGLIAHELTHVGQQTGAHGDSTRFFTQRGGDEMEKEAQQVGERVLAHAGNANSLQVDEYVCHYEGESGAISRNDEERLNRISVQALQQAGHTLRQRGQSHTSVAHLSVAIDLDLVNLTDSEAAQIWTDALLSALPINSRSTSDQSPSLQSGVEQIARKELFCETVSGVGMPQFVCPVMEITDTKDWLSMDREMWRSDVRNNNSHNSFIKAAIYNTQHLLPDEYGSIAERSAYYGVMHALIQNKNGTKGVDFFDAAQRVTDSNEVGAIEGPIGWSLHSKEALKVLTDVNKKLLVENMQVIRRLLYERGRPTNPKDAGSDTTLSARAFDLQMVEKEQGVVEDYLKSHANEISAGDIKDLNDDLNFNGFVRFAGELLGQVGDTTPIQWAKEALGVKELNFRQRNHREAIGKALVFLLHKDEFLTNNHAGMDNVKKAYFDYLRKGQANGAGAGMLRQSSPMQRSAIPGTCADIGTGEAQAQAVEAAVAGGMSPLPDRAVMAPSFGIATKKTPGDAQPQGNSAPVPTATVPMRQVTTPDGKVTLITEEQYQALTLQQLTHLGKLLHIIDDEADWHKRDEQDFLQHHNAFGWSSDKLGGVTPPPLTLWDRPKVPLHAGMEAVNARKLDAAARDLALGREVMKQASNEWMAYLQGTIKGADRGIAGTTVVRDVSFSIAIGGAAIVAAPVVLAGAGAAVAAAGATGTTAAVLTGGATVGALTVGGGAAGAVLRGGSNAAGQAVTGHVDWHQVGQESAAGARSGAVDAFGSAVTMGTGAVAGNVFRRGVSTLGTRLARSSVANAISGGVSNAAGALLNPPPIAPGQKPESWADKAKRVGVATGLGVIGGGLTGGFSETLLRLNAGTLSRMFTSGASAAAGTGATAAI